MKRVIAGVLALLFLLGAAGAGGWFFLRGAGRVSPAAYLPADTVAYVEIPDGTKTFLRYQGSQLRQIVEHPEARQLGGGAAALFRQAIPALAAEKADAETLAHLRKAGSEFGLALGGASFLAVTKLDVGLPAAGAAPDPRSILGGIGAVGGFHDSPDGGRHVDALVRELGALGKAAPAAVAGTHGAAAYTYVEVPAAGVRLCRARWKGWDLFSLGEVPLFDFLDRVAAPASSAPSLRNAPNFAATVPKVAAGADLVSYFAFDSVWALYGRWMAALAPQANAGALIDKLRFMKAAAGGTFFRGGELVERSVLLAPEAERGAMAGTYQPIPLASLRFTTPDTLLYFAQSFDPEAQYAWQKQSMAALSSVPPAANGAPAPSPFDAVEKQVAAQGLDLHENFLRATGPELALVVDWPAGQAIPDAMLVLAVKDAAKFGPFYDKYAALATATLGAMAKAETFQVGSYKAVSFAPPMAPWATPTLFDGADFWGLSLTASGAKRLLAAPGGGLTAAGLAGSERLPGKTHFAMDLKTGAAAARAYAAGRPALAAYLGKTDAGRAAAARLPAASQLAPLLGELRGLGTTDGDFIYHATTSPDGGLGVAGVALAGVEAMAAGRKASVAPVPGAPPVPAPAAGPAAP